VRKNLQEKETTKKGGDNKKRNSPEKGPREDKNSNETWEETDQGNTKKTSRNTPLLRNTNRDQKKETHKGREKNLNQREKEIIKLQENR